MPKQLLGFNMPLRGGRPTSGPSSNHQPTHSYAYGASNPAKRPAIVDEAKPPKAARTSPRARASTDTRPGPPPFDPQNLEDHLATLDGQSLDRVAQALAIMRRQSALQSLKMLAGGAVAALAQQGRLASPAAVVQVTFDTAWEMERGAHWDVEAGTAVHADGSLSVDLDFRPGAWQSLWTLLEKLSDLDPPANGDLLVVTLPAAAPTNPVCATCGKPA